MTETTPSIDESRNEERRYRAGSPLTLLFLIALAGFGLYIVGRAASFYRTLDPLAFGITIIMAGALIFGLLELAMRYRRSTKLGHQLNDAVKSSPSRVQELRGEIAPVLRAHLERDPAPSSAPVFTPYLIGALVMLGLLGTFLGLFETLRGAHSALAASADIDSLRAGLSQPMEGLMRSFGTSAAGVASSAVLGLGAVLIRNHARRFEVAVHSACAGPLAHLGASQRQLSALEALAEQGAAWPDAVAALTEAANLLRETNEEQRAAREALETRSNEEREAIAAEARTQFDRMIASIAEQEERAAARLVEREAEVLKTFEKQREAAESSATSAADTAKQVSAELRKLAEAQASAIDQFEGRASERHSALIASAESSIRSLRDDLREASEAHTSALSQSGEAIAGAFQERANAHLEQLGSAAAASERTLREATSAMSENIARELTNLASSLGELSSAQREQLDASSERHANLLSDAVAGLDERFATGVATLASRAGEAIAPALATITERTQELSTNHLREVRGALEEERQSTLASLREREENQTLAIANQLERIDALIARQEERASALANSIATTHAEGIDKLESLRAQVEERIAQSSAQTLEQITQSSAQTLEQITQSSARTLEQVTQSSAQTVERVTQSSAQTVEQVTQSSVSTLEQVTTLRAGFDERFQSFDHERTEMLTKMQDVLNELKSQSESLGTHVQETKTALAQAEAEATERTLASIEQLENLASSVSRSGQEQTEHAAEIAQVARQTLAEASAQSGAQIQELIATASQHLSAQGAQLNDLETRILERYSSYAEVQRTELAEAASVTSSAASIVHASGAELGAAVAMFTESVERHNEAAQRWLTALGDVERAVLDAGEGAAVDVLGEYLTRTHELFDQQLGFQQELMQQLGKAPDVQA